MIDLYYWTTPNGHKITMFLEESELPYRIVPVNISKGDQFKLEFLAISPNNRMPTIVDHEPYGGGAPISVFESGAILLYLAEKIGKFIPSDIRGRVETVQWLFWQMGGLARRRVKTITSANTRPRSFPMPSIATSRRPIGSTAFSTSASLIAILLQVNIRLPTWQSIHGSFRGSVKHRISRIFLI